MTIEDEFIQAVTQHKGSIYTVCYMFSSNPDEIADLYQDILANLWSGFEKFRGDSKLNTWIYRVSMNTCLMLQRKKKRRPESIPLSVDLNLFEDNDEGTRQIALLYKRINKLDKFDKAIVLLWLESLTYEEIGEILGISAGNVSVRLVRIREQLKKMSND